MGCARFAKPSAALDGGRSPVGARHELAALAPGRPCRAWRLAPTMFLAMVGATARSEARGPSLEHEQETSLKLC
jgi:hypothetical protein